MGWVIVVHTHRVVACTWWDDDAVSEAKACHRLNDAGYFHLLSVGELVPFDMATGAARITTGPVYLGVVMTEFWNRLEHGNFVNTFEEHDTVTLEFVLLGRTGQGLL